MFLHEHFVPRADGPLGDKSVDHERLSNFARAPVRTSGPLADGFEIEPGSGLVGVVFPLGSFAVGLGKAWQAVLRVDGDGQRVFDGYVRQAEALGAEQRSEHCCRPDRQWCNDPDDGVTDDDPAGPFPFVCGAFALEPDDLSLSLRGYLDAESRGFVHIYASGLLQTPCRPSRTVPRRG